MDAEEQPNDLARGLYLLARRIKSVGGKQKLVTLKMVCALSAPDLAHLQRAADELDEQVEVEIGSLGKPSSKLRTLPAVQWAVFAAQWRFYCAMAFLLRNGVFTAQWRFCYAMALGL